MPDRARGVGIEAFDIAVLQDGQGVGWGRSRLRRPAAKAMAANRTLAAYQPAIVRVGARRAGMLAKSAFFRGGFSG